MNSTGRIGASAEGSTPSWMVRLLARSSSSTISIWPGHAGADVEALDLRGGWPTPMALTGSLAP